jgi:hypothetical protein
MATVSPARDLKHDRPIALKVLRPEVGAILGATPFTDSVVREWLATARWKPSRPG